MLRLIGLTTGKQRQAMADLCPSCEAPINSQDQFCGECGTKLNAPGAQGGVPYDRDVAFRHFQTGYRRIALDQTAGAARQSIADFDRAIESAPDMAEIFLGKAQALTYVDDLPRALETLDKSLALGFCDNETVMHLDLGFADPDGDVLEVEIGPGFALMLRGDILYGLGRNEEASEQIDALLERGELDEYEADVWALRALILIELERLEEAKAACDRADGLEQDLTRAVEARGRISLAEDQPDEAVEVFSRLIALAPDDPDSYLLRATAYHNADRVGEALAEYRRTLALLQDTGASLARIREVRQLMESL